jgi:hypothetical protein
MVTEKFTPKYFRYSNDNFRLYANVWSHKFQNDDYDLMFVWEFFYSEYWDSMFFQSY